MGAEPMTLPDFLLARIAEDEAVARRLSDSIVSDLRSCGMGTHEPPLGLPSATMTPDRALAECEAKRRMLAYFAAGWGYEDHLVASDLMRLMALPYADHPDYREQWKP